MNLLSILVTCLGMLILFPINALPQKADSLFPDPETLLERKIEDYTAALKVESDFSQWLEELEILKSAPVNLNSASVDELNRLPLLNEQQLQNLSEYIKEFGLLASVYELQNIDGFNQAFIEQIEPYICFDFNPEQPFRLSSALRYGHSKLETRYQRVPEPQSGYLKVNDSLRKLNPNQYFLGSADGFGIRYRYVYREQLQIGLMAEKDPGEAFLKGPDTIPRGFDYYSGHLYLRNIGNISYLAIGDYQAQFGQGLTFSTGISMGMMAGLLPARKRSALIKPHNSFNENSFLRGAAAGITIKDFSFTAFYSHRKKDGNQNIADTSDSYSYISSLQETGYHRTLSEIADRKTVTEQLMGICLQWSKLRWKTGSTYYHLSYSAPIIQQLNDGNGNKNSGPGSDFAGIDFSYSFKRLVLYGEYSKQFHGGYALIQGLNLSLHPMFVFSSVLRSYGFNYNNQYSSGVGNSGSHTKETAFYLGFEATFRKFSITAFSDYQHYTGLRYRVDAPSHDTELGLELQYSLGRKGEIRIRYRNAVNPRNSQHESSGVQQVVNTMKEDYQWNLTFQPINWIKTGTRIYMCNFYPGHGGNQTGYMLSQDVKIQCAGSNVGIALRYAVFDTESYETRIYSYESDLPSSFSVPSVNGSGSRYYAMISVKVFKETQLWIRFSRTMQDGQFSISEGATEIMTDHKSDIRFMLSVRF
jgi:hypothetical protein